MATLFISDLHLAGERPEVLELFRRFLAERATGAEALYILGDLFEAWLGDDAVLPEYRPLLDAMRAVVEGGTPVYVMHGNRDFLMGADFEAMTGARLIDDPTVIDLHGTPTLLMHGDLLCTDDVPYQEFRAMVRDPDWQRQFLARSVEERVAFARGLRDKSREETGQKEEAIMDVNADAVTRTLREHGVRRLIHGHTHRPAVHDLEVDGAPAQRIVLPEWFGTGGYLVCDETGCRPEAWPG